MLPDMEQPKARRTCPGCESLMEVHTVEGVELDRCPFCGGVWFDRGELEAVAKRPLPIEELEGHTSRRCAYCHITLSTAIVHAVPIEVCSACGGAYLDDGELAELAEREFSFRRSQPQPPANGAPTFTCRGCGDVFPMADGMTTSSFGLACPKCYGQFEASNSPLIEGMVKTEYYAIGGRRLGALSLIELALDFFTP